MYNRKRTLRFVSVFLFLIGCLVVFSVKLVLIQIFRSDYLSEKAAKQHNHFVRLEPKRGTIYDRRYRPLAVNVSAYSLFANPRIMSPEDKQRVLREAAPLLDVDTGFLKERLSRDKFFVWLERKIPQRTADKISELKIHGLDFIKESKRHYPGHYLASHILGFAGMDNTGLEGLELKFNEELKGRPGWSRILRDARQRDLLIEKGFFPPKNGFSLVLTIDENIQYIAEQALDAAFEKNKAKGASVIVMDPRTGEILALANRPTYDLANFEESPVENRTNRALAYVYEPGSVFKIVAASAALEEEVFVESDTIFCENGQYRVGNHILHDHHPLGTLTFREVIEHSSNIGTTKIAQKLGPSRFYKYAVRFGFGRKTGINLEGEVPGLLRPPSRWSKTSIGAIPIGHEVAVTPIQLATAISAIANDGVAMRPYVVKYIKDDQDEMIRAYEPRVIDRVISDDTAQRVKAILQGVVENGTGKRAQIEGVTVAGKTGTAQKVINGQYSHNKFFASFIGFAPVDNPQVAAVVMFDEPRPSYYGGTVAAPVFQEIVEKTLRYLAANPARQEGP